MNNEDADRLGENIPLIPVLTLEVAPDERGWISYDDALKAVVGSGPNIGGPAAVFVCGELSGCAQNAAMMLATTLAGATSITIYGRGHGISQFTTALRSAITQERQWRIERQVSE